MKCRVGPFLLLSLGMPGTGSGRQPCKKIRMGENPNEDGKKP
jgi:hypothetical protein